MSIQQIQNESVQMDLGENDIGDAGTAVLGYVLCGRQKPFALHGIDLCR